MCIRDRSDTVDKCDEYLNKVMIMIQELEGKFVEFDDYILQLSEKREEIYDAFESKKQTILDKLNRRIFGLFSSAERILKGVDNRLKSFNSVDEINGYLATDIMIEKVRDIISDLNELGDSVKGDEITSKLKKVKEEAIRQLKDLSLIHISCISSISKSFRTTFYVSFQCNSFSFLDFSNVYAVSYTQLDVYKRQIK